MSDNTTTNQPATAGDAKSSTTGVQSSSDGSASSSGINTPIVADQASSDKPGAQQASSGQPYNPNYQGYGNNANHNNYNNNTGNNTYYNKNQYHKNYTGPGGRQNNYNANANSNPRYNNNKKQYNNQKMNHHHHNHHSQQPPQQPYMNYGAYNAGTPLYGYYPLQTVYVPGLPMQYSMAPTPAQQYAPIPPPGAASQPKPISTPPTPKIKLTTKDGKPVDLEEKKRQTASSTPIGSPHPTVATTTNSAAKTSETEKTPAASTDATTPETETKSASLSAAEEFKRRVKERAAAAAAKAKAEKDASEKPEPEVASAELQTPASTESTPAAAATPEPSEKQEEVKPVPAETASAASEITEEPAPETKTAEVAPKEPEQPAKEEVAETTPEVKEAVESVTETREESATEEPKEEPQVAEEEPKEAEVEKEKEAEEEEEEETPASEEVKEEEEESPAAAEPSAAPEFSISQFLGKLNTVTPIDDIYATKYPEGIQGVDSSKKIAGKKYRYDPQFLIQFRDVVTYAIDPQFKTRLDSLDIHANTLKRSGSTRDGSSRGGLPGKFPGGLPARFNGPGSGPKGGPQFDPSRQNSRSGSKRGGRGASSRDKSTRKGGQSKRGGRGDRPDIREKTEEELVKEAKPVEEVKPLEKSANRWVPKSRMQKKEVKVAEDGTVILDKDDIERKTNSLLNKLTLEMFTEISDEILAIGNQAKWEKDAETIKQIMSLIFAKACDEPYWSEMYAKLCAKMCKTLPDSITDETSTLKDGTHPSGGGLARRILLSTCQKEYEKGWSDKLPTNPDGSPLEPEMMSDEYYAMAAAKRRGLGLVKFIGHLFNLNMLNNQIIFVCLKDQIRNTVDPSEDSLENLTQLNQTVGPKLDADESTRAMMKLVFDYIERILQEVKLSSRIKFMLMDLQDLRKANWVSNKADAGPKTIEEIHRDAEIKKMEEEKAKQDKKRRQQQYGNDSRSSSSRGGSSWNNNNNNPSSNFVKKSPSFVNARAGSNRSPSASNVQNTDSQRETSKRSDSTQFNRFAALGRDDDDE
ncbi:hypothetical protein Cantr_04456 [Candida viswanathii]|uniref:MIF4G domain-containing protein n=1 Tax=Candida viswanathii TaxID=5486 RepID=A0A367XN34_9ASCO|nr:hypothetical protein Cantr_04456 [Candida viswanathii]